MILDQRVRRMGSHHQKFVVLRHDEDPSRDIAFVGGIDLCHGRRDDADHGGDPQPLPMSAAYGDSPPWHDVQLQIRGPAVGVLDTVFRERWEDPNSPDADHPIAWIHDKLHHTRLHADKLPPQLPPPPECGPHLVQTPAHVPAIRPPLPLRPARRARRWPAGTRRRSPVHDGWCTSRTSTCGPPRSPGCSPRP